MEDITTNRLLKIKEIVYRTGHSRSHIYSLMKKGEFPKQVKKGNTARWKIEQVIEYINNL